MQGMALTSVSPRAYETKPTSDPVELLIVIPAYNEEGAVAATVKRIRAALSELPTRFEIIVVDDGSTDGTRTAGELSGAVVLSLAENGGFAFIVLVLRIVMLFEPLRIFIPLGGALFVLGLCKLSYDITVWNLSETAVFSFLGALIIWSIGLIADMIGRLHLRP
jgi:hypothetical protein